MKLPLIPQPGMFPQLPIAPPNAGGPRLPLPPQAQPKGPGTPRAGIPTFSSRQPRMPKIPTPMR